MQFVCVNVYVYMCVYKPIHSYKYTYIRIYICVYFSVYFSIPNKTTRSDQDIYHPYRFLTSIRSFHLINSLWSLKLIWKYSHRLFHHSEVLFPFLLSLFVQKTMLSLPRSQSFSLCAFRKNKEPSEVDDTEDKCENAVTIENGIPCDPLDMKGGHINDTFMTENERLTSLWRAAVLLPQETQHLFLYNCRAPQMIKDRLQILCHRSSFVRNFECAWKWKAISYTHEDHWNHKLLTTPNIPKYFSENTVRKSSHAAFVFIDLKMHQYLNISRNEVRPLYISYSEDIRKNLFSSGEYL